MERRLAAMAAKCKRRGGDCPCRMDRRGERCQAIEAIQQRISELNEELEELLLEQTWLDTPLATVRDDWELPTKPPGDYRPTVIHDGYGWWPHWHSETESVDVVAFPATEKSWPFVERHAYSDDWERLGFEVV